MSYSEGCGGVPPGQVSQHRGVFLAGEQVLHGLDVLVTVRPGQEGQIFNLPPGAVLQRRVAAAALHQPGVGGLLIAQAVPEEVAQAEMALLAQGGKDLRVSVQGTFPLAGDDAV